MLSTFIFMREKRGVDHRMDIRGREREKRDVIYASQRPGYGHEMGQA